MASHQQNIHIRTKRAPGQILIDYVADSVENEEEFHFLRFEFLQRLNIVSLEVDLAKLKSNFQLQHESSPQELEELRAKLQQYTIAIRDYQYLQDKKSLGKTEQRGRKARLHDYFYSAEEATDPWDSHYSYFQDEQQHRAASIDPLRRMLMRHLTSRLTFSHSEHQAREKEYNEGASPRRVSGFVDRLARFIIAIAGGVFLIVPMIIMTLQSSETKSLVIVSVGVVIFALILSFGIQVSNVETLVSTATYAAVLVVFVGTSGSGTGSSAGASA